MMLIRITITRVLVWSLAAIARKNRCRSAIYSPGRARHFSNSRRGDRSCSPAPTPEHPQSRLIRRASPLARPRLTPQQQHLHTPSAFRWHDIVFSAPSRGIAILILPGGPGGNRTLSLVHLRKPSTAAASATTRWTRFSRSPRTRPSAMGWTRRASIRRLNELRRDCGPTTPATIGVPRSESLGFHDRSLS
jgi:hypothetical protein